MPLDRAPADRDAQAQAILRANDRGGYTVPSARLYPFQWNWDSPLTAIGWGRFDLERAWREFEMLISGQWADGMIPHIIFHAPSDGYYCAMMEPELNKSNFVWSCSLSLVNNIQIQPINSENISPFLIPNSSNLSYLTSF